MELIVTTTEKTEIRSDVAGALDEWAIHLVYRADGTDSEADAWMDFTTQDPAIAAAYELGTRWTLEPVTGA